MMEHRTKHVMSLVELFSKRTTTEWDMVNSVSIINNICYKFPVSQL